MKKKHQGRKSVFQRSLGFIDTVYKPNLLLLDNYLTQYSTYMEKFNFNLQFNCLT